MRKQDKWTLPELLSKDAARGMEWVGGNKHGYKQNDI